MNIAWLHNNIDVLYIIQLYIIRFINRMVFFIYLTLEISSVFMYQKYNLSGKSVLRTKVYSCDIKYILNVMI